jgi:hypothetical protein
MDLSVYSLYGDQANTSAIPQSMLNSNADGTTDWGAVLAQGIRGAAQGAIRASVNEKYASGQLVAPYGTTGQAFTGNNLLLIAVVAFFLLKS